MSDCKNVKSRIFEPFFSQPQGENYTAEIILMLDLFPKKAFNFILIAKSAVVPI